MRRLLQKEEEAPRSVGAVENHKQAQRRDKWLSIRAFHKLSVYESGDRHRRRQHRRRDHLAVVVINEADGLTFAFLGAAFPWRN
jgi:hypothetical protein